MVLLRTVHNHLDANPCQHVDRDSFKYFRRHQGQDVPLCFQGTV
jgi:hypothetical protein